MTTRIEIRGARLTAAAQVLDGARSLGVRGLSACEVVGVHVVRRVDIASTDETTAENDAVVMLCEAVLVDPVTETYRLGDPDPVADSVTVVEVTAKPGVTDAFARELERAAADIGLGIWQAATVTRYELTGDLEPAAVDLLMSRLLVNETVEQAALGQIHPEFVADVEVPPLVETVAIRDLDSDALMEVSRTRLLSLDADEMAVIQAFFANEGRDPRDAELETLAQTWSEHCVHKTFRAVIEMTELDQGGTVIDERTVDGLLDSCLRAVTDELSPPWLRTAFVDDAGVVAFDDTHDMAFKVETHNHPSALEPFGGANTGVGGVVRDVIAVSARPIAATDVLCFGPQDLPLSELPDGLLHPKRIAEGVVAGVGDYGNKLGLPTVNGAVFYHPGYLGNPLVFCGCVGLAPRDSHPTEANVGDLVVSLGGKTGRDGVHGATFSSAELTHDTATTTGSAVQIGDPITEKGLIEVIELARDQQLYTLITDCGAGGLSSSVGEMGEDLGVEIDLAAVPLKYDGLLPWEIWISEAQERIVIAVPPASLDQLQSIASAWDVELSVIGTFTGRERLEVSHGSTRVIDLPMSFLHDGLPRRHMTAVWQPPANGVPNDDPAPSDYTATLVSMLADPNVASKEHITRTYDHEVRGGTIVRPTCGPAMDGPTDAAVLKPLGTWQHDKGIVVSNGINPRLGRLDPYRMALSAIDEAVRNAVAVGADPDRLAILDNFCWGNPTLPDRLGGLVRAAEGCRDGARLFRTPFISGKDSLFNEFEGSPIPGTLLISAIGIIPDVHEALTSDLAASGNALYLVGQTGSELGGSLLYEHLGRNDGEVPGLPDGLLDLYRRFHRLAATGHIASCHDLSEGGLAVAIAEMCIGGRLGAEIDLTVESASSTSAATALFAETNGRLLAEVAPTDREAFEAGMGADAVRVGTVTNGDRLVVKRQDVVLVDASTGDLASSFGVGLPT